MEDTYFNILPKELLHLISCNYLEMKDISNLLGYDFHKYNLLLFNSIIRRDFGKDILTDLIDIKNLELNIMYYDEFVHFFKSFIKNLNDMMTRKTYPCILFDKLKDVINIHTLEKIGISIPETLYCTGMVLKNCSFLYYFDSETLGIFYGDALFIKDVNINNFTNLIFFLSKDSIFKIY